jgi:hypothetical protein
MKKIISSLFFTGVLLNASVGPTATLIANTPPQPKGKESGGGTYSLGAIWGIIKLEMVPRLKAHGLDSIGDRIFTEGEIRNLVELMDESKVKIDDTDELLYPSNSSGQHRVSVDALNFPNDNPKRIQLYKPTWTTLIASGADVKHLLLHEFMGLLKIDDSKHKSVAMFPYRSSPLDFKLNRLACGVNSSYIRLEQHAATPVRASGTSFGSFDFSDVKITGKKDCIKNVPGTSECGLYSGIPIKTISAESDFQYGNGAGDPIETITKYIVKIQAQFKGPHFQRGTGGAASTYFHHDSELHIQWDVLRRVSQKDTRIGSGQIQASKNEFGVNAPYYSFTIPSFELKDLLAQNGYSLVNTSTTGRFYDLFSFYNVREIMDQAAKDAGLPTHGPSFDGFIRSRVFANSPTNALPIFIEPYCYLVD